MSNKSEEKVITGEVVPNKPEENAVTGEVALLDETYIAFNKPVSFDGQTINGISLDLENLTGEDIEKAEVQFVIGNPQIAAQTPLKEMSKGFLSILAAKASKKPVELIRKLSAPDYAKVTTKVQIFLMSGN